MSRAPSPTNTIYFSMEAFARTSSRACREIYPKSVYPDWADDQWSPLRFLIIFSRKTPFSHRFVGKLRVGELLRAKLKPFVWRPMIECAKCVVLGIFSYFYVKKAPDFGCFFRLFIDFSIKERRLRTALFLGFVGYQRFRQVCPLRLLRPHP